MKIGFFLFLCYALLGINVLFAQNTLTLGSGGGYKDDITAQILKEAYDELGIDLNIEVLPAERALPYRQVIFIII